MQVALGRSPEEEYRDNLSQLGEMLGGNCTLFFTNKPKEEVLQFFKEYKSLDFARAGFKATENFVIPKGEMPFAHSMMEEFKKLRLPGAEERRHPHARGLHGVQDGQGAHARAVSHSRSAFRPKVMCRSCTTSR